MFEFGKDLRKLFAQARDSEDLSWLELIGVDLLEVEARQQSTDAGRVSCVKPCRSALRANALWREHARRTGRATSIDRALKAAADAACTARSDDDASRAAIAVAQTRMLRFDLSGGLDLLDKAEVGVAAIARPRRGDTEMTLIAVKAGLKARRARATGDDADFVIALDAMNTALKRSSVFRMADGDELRLDQAGLALELGLQRRDAALLDQAGQTLKQVIETASPDYRPLTRARALTLCAAGLSALSVLADDAQAGVLAREMFDAAADQFTPDHSPLDWVTVQIVRAGQGDVAIDTLVQTESLTAGQGLVMGALARDLRLSRQIDHARGDRPALARIEAELRRALSNRSGKSAPLDWAVDQIALGRLNLLRSDGAAGEPRDIGMAVVEAAAVAREYGIMSIATQAETTAERLIERV